MYKILTGKYDVDVTPKVLLECAIRQPEAICSNKTKVEQSTTCVNFISLIGWLMLGTVSLTMLYYLKLLTLLNHDLINFGNIKV